MGRSNEHELDLFKGNCRTRLAQLGDEYVAPRSDLVNRREFGTITQQMLARTMFCTTNVFGCLFSIRNKCPVCVGLTYQSLNVRTNRKKWKRAELEQVEKGV